MKDTLRAMKAKRAEGDQGFTLIELLVVVVIIGILVAIAIPVYLNYQKSAADKAAQSDIRGGITAVESFYTTNASKYPITAASQTESFPLTAAGNFEPQRLTVTGGNTLSYILTGSTYKLCAQAGSDGKKYLYDSSVGGSVKENAAINIATCAA